MQMQMQGKVKVKVRPKYAQIQPITTPDFPIDLAVEVIKKIARVRANIAVTRIEGVYNGIEQEVQIGASPADHERCLVFDQRPFECQFCREDGDRACTMK